MMTLQKRGQEPIVQSTRRAAAPRLVPDPFSIKAFIALLITIAGGYLLQQPATAQTSAAGIEVQDCVVRFACEVDVPARESGLVAQIHVTRNDMIDAGAPLARLDDRSLLIRRRSAQLRLDAARSDALDDIHLRYAQSALAEAEAELETSRAIQRDVLGAVPMSQVRKLRLAVERGELEVAEAKKRTKRAEVDVELREADISVIDDQLRNLHAESPIKGVVLEVARREGEWIEKGQAIASIGRIDRLHVHALLRSDQLSPAACKGLPVSIHWQEPASGTQRSLRGKVLSSDPQMLPGGRFRMHAEVVNQVLPSDPQQWQLHPGAEVRMKIYVSAATAERASRSHSR